MEQTQMSTDLVETGDNQTVIRPRSIEELTALGVNKWKAVDAFVEKAQRKVNAQRIEVGFILLELKQRIDAGEHGGQWWKYFDENFRRSRRDGDRLMAIAAADDPTYAYELEKAAQRQRMHDLRASRALAHNNECAPSQPEQNQEVEPDKTPVQSKLPLDDGPALTTRRINDFRRNLRKPIAGDDPEGDAAADPTITRIVQDFLKLKPRQQDRCIRRLMASYKRSARAPAVLLG
jgi:hypothetical protein